MIDDADIELVCIDKQHLKTGLSVPDGEGHYTVSDRKWAYCSAARPDEPHTWADSGGIKRAELRHNELNRFAPA